MKRTSDFFSGSKGTNKIVIMALPVMVLDGLKNKHMDFPYGSFISFGVTRNISVTFPIFVYSKGGENGLGFLMNK